MAQSAKARMTETLVEAARREARTMPLDQLDRKVEAARVRSIAVGGDIDHAIYGALVAARAGRES